jgi:hypothetical protein
MNLLDQFVLQHVQVSELNAELIKVSKESGTQDAKVELNLTPRPMQADAGKNLPAYQVSARLRAVVEGPKTSLVRRSGHAWGLRPSTSKPAGNRLTLRSSPPITPALPGSSTPCCNRNYADC